MIIIINTGWLDDEVELKVSASYISKMNPEHDILKLANLADAKSDKQTTLYIVAHGEVDSIAEYSPKKLAKLATKDAKKEIEILKEKQQLKQVKEEAELMEDILKLKDSVINITTKVNKEGHLFAGIDKKAIVDVIKDQKALDIGEDFIVLEKPIKEASEHVIKLKVGSKEFSFTLKITAEKE